MRILRSLRAAYRAAPARSRQRFSTHDERLFRCTESALIATIALLFLTGCEPRLDSADPEQRRKAVEKVTDQAILAKVALADRYASVREIAVKKLVDQTILAKIACEDRNAQIRETAATKLTVEKLLAKVALNAEDWEIRQIAAKQIVDQSTLMQIAQTEENGEVLLTVGKKLADRGMLPKATVDWDAGRIARAEAIATASPIGPAFRCLSGNLHARTRDLGQSIARIKLALEEKCVKTRFPGTALEFRSEDRTKKYVRSGATSDTHIRTMHGEVYFLTLKQAGKILAEARWSSNLPDSFPVVAATGALDDGFRGTALPPEVEGEQLLEEFFDQPVFTDEDLAELARSAIPEVRFGAVANMGDVVSLAKVAADIGDWELRERILRKVEIDEVSDGVLKAAVRKISEQVVTWKSIVDCWSEDARCARVSRITNQDILARVAIEYDSDSVRRAAVEKLVDQSLLIRIAEEDKSPSVRGSAVEKLNDPSVVATIAEEDPNGNVRWKAVERLREL